MQNIIANRLSLFTLASILCLVTELSAAPSNDSFANRISLRGMMVTTIGDNLEATRDSGEPYHVDGTGGASVWWSWTAPASGAASITTSNSTFDTLLAVYTGTVISNLAVVATNDDAAGIWPRSRVDFEAVADTVYQIAVDGWGSPPDSGSIQLNIAGPSPGGDPQAPVTEITQPSNHSIVRAGELILEVDAYDLDGAIAKVEFFESGGKIGEDTLHPYQLTVNNAPVGNYQLTAVATDHSGLMATSAVVNVSVALNPPPWVEFVSPFEGEMFTVPLNLTVAVAAFDEDVVGNVELFAGDTKVGETYLIPYLITWSNVVAGNYALRAVATDTLGAAATSAVVNITVTGNYPPMVSLVAPPDQSAFAAPAAILVSASASDRDGTISKVEFYEGPARLGQALSTPFNFAWNNVNTGQYALRAVATDNGGLSATSLPISLTVTQQVFTFTNTLVAMGSDWKYLDIGIGPDASWNLLAHDDSTWGSGPAELGYGDGDEATVVSFGPDAGNKYITTYFRRVFEVANADTYTNLNLRVLFDDGALVYLNGQEVFRSSNMPVGPVDYNTTATSTAQEPNSEAIVDLDPVSLMEGPNILAAEVHQANATSSDIGFDLGLTGISDFSFSNGPPLVMISSPTNGSSFEVPVDLVVEVLGEDDFGLSKVEVFNGGLLLGEDAASPYRVVLSNATAGAYALTARATDIHGLVSTSAVVEVTITGDYAPFVFIRQPLDGARMVSPADILIEADAVDVDGTISLVEFFQDTTPLGQATTAPYAVGWNGVGIGDYALYAVATDGIGNVRTSSVVNVSVKANVPPQVQIDYPLPNAFFINTEIIPIQVHAADTDDGLSSVQFLANQIQLDVDVNAPYELEWSNMPTGRYVLKAVAMDLGGLSATSAPVTITVVDSANAFGGLGFDGIAGFVTFGAAPALGLQVFTLETWFKWSGAGDDISTGGGGIRAIPILAKGRGESDGNNRDMNYFLGVQPDTHVLVADLEEGSGGNTPGLNHPVAGVTPVTTNVWHHGAVSYDGATWRLYLDGNLETELYVGQPTRSDSIQHASLGSALNSTGVADGFFAGVLDEVRIWNYVRSVSQISSNRAWKIEAEAGLVGRWALDETGGNTAADSSGSGLTGTLVNGPDWTLGYPFASPPFLEVLSPANGTVYFTPDDVSFQVSAVDDDGEITRVEYFEGENQLGESLSAPFGFVWSSPPAGHYLLTAVATDNSSLSTTSAPVSIAVENAVVQLTSPAYDARFISPDPIPLTAAVSDAGGAIVKVDFYDGGVHLNEATIRPFAYTWLNAALGDHLLTAVATDAGGIQNTSAAIRLLVVSNVAPAIAFAFPADLDSFYYPTNLQLRISASDTDGRVDVVEFFANGLKLGQATHVPFFVQWVQPAIGDYALTAVATDDRGLAATTAVLNISVLTNPPPIVTITQPLDGQGFFAPANIAINAFASDAQGLSVMDFYEGDTRLTQDFTSPYEFTWSGVPIGEYNLRVVATDLFGMASTSSPVSISVTNNDPPVVALTSPTNSAVFSAPPSLLLSATASDDDGITMVEFYSSSRRLGSASASPFDYFWDSPDGGSHVLTAVAQDGVGLRATSAPVSISIIGSVTATNVMIAQGADWKYLDNGSDQAAAWRAVDFDDSAWPSGPAELGYGDGDEATLVSFGGDADNKHITTYFRHTFTLTHSARFNSLNLRLRRDDGGVVYLNGAEIFRVNMPGGDIGYQTFASSTSENAEDTGSASPALLLDGPNVVAVEIHQREIDSSDISFDFELWGTFDNNLPVAFLTSPTNSSVFDATDAPVDIPLEATAYDGDGSVAKVEFFANGLSLGEDAQAPYQWVWSNVIAAGNYTLTAVATDDAGSLMASPEVQITVLGNFLPTVQLTSPQNGSAFLLPASILLAATAADADGQVTKVAFYANGELLSEDATAPYSFTWAATNAGDYILTAVAMDDSGAEVSSDPVSISLLDVPPPQTFAEWGDTWKYLDEGSDQGTAWRNPEFDDSGWPEGLAQLGYGESDQATTLNQNGQNGFIRAFYFRKTFVLTDPTVYKSLQLQVLMDDGSVAYLNGTEVFRFNMPAGNINYLTWANVNGENTIAGTNVPTSLLRAGQNVLAVSVHQADSGSSDVSFDAQFIGSTTNALPVVTLSGPADQSVFVEPADITLTASANDSDGFVTNVQFFQGSLLLGEDSSPPFSFLWADVSADNYNLKAVAFDDQGESATSAVATVYVVVSTAPSIASFDPPGGNVNELTRLTVNFNEPVTGVDAADLLVNGIPATSLAVSNTAFTFAFPQPPEGFVTVNWAPQHGILDREVPPKEFGGSEPGETVQYHLTDNLNPAIANTWPAPGAMLSSLTQIRITFSEPVGGVNAADLLINDVPAQQVSGSMSGPYHFEFDPPANGPIVEISWAQNHGIQDFADTGNPLDSDPWTYTLATDSFGTNVVISEIMYHPGSQLDSEEFIEIFNSGNIDVDLNGWSLTGGINYDFPNVTLQARRYLVVAADSAAFSAKYPGVTNWMGGWRGRLSNSDEDVRLRNAQGDIVNRVSYADSGDWAIRQRGFYDRGYYGWDWYAAHDGYATNSADNQWEGNKSLELINPTLPNDNGQNWGASDPENGTPGLPNSVASGNIAPLIYDVAHYPPLPLPSNPVTITARILDENPNGPASATLYYRNATSTSLPAFSTTSMFDDGQHSDGLALDGVFGAVLPASSAGTIIEFYVSAADASGNTRTWPAAARQLNGSFQQTANALYQVHNENADNTMPTYRIIMTASEQAERASMTRQSDAQMNATFISSDGVDVRVRHNCGIRVRGQGTRNCNPPNYRINFPTDRLWNGMSAINMNSQYIHSQLASSALALKSGLPAAAGRAVRFRINGVDYTGSGTPSTGQGCGGSAFGSYLMIEPLNGDWAAAHFPDDGNGNVYRGIPAGGGWSARLVYLGNDPAAYAPNYSKTSNRGANDYTDLINLSAALAVTDDSFPVNVRNHVSVDSWMRYFAVNSLLVSSENGLPTGVGDDYALYRGVTDPRFRLVPHDFDTCLGEGDGSYNNWGVGASIWLPADRDPSNLPWASRFMRHNEFAPIYFRELMQLIETTFSTNELSQTLDHVLKGWVPDYIIDRMKTYAGQRAANVLNQIPRDYSATPSLPQQFGIPFSSSPNVSFYGQGNALETRSVRINGNLANWTAWNGNWNGSVTLLPGLNRVQIQWLDENDVEAHRQAVDVWYDDGSTQTITEISLEQNWTLTAAGGPYLFANSMAVEAGFTLTIEPGTTLYFAQGARLNIRGQLVAEGTELQRIRMTTTPVAGNRATWGGIRFENPQADNRLTYTDMEFASTADPIEMVNSRLLVDNVTWTGTTRTIIDLDNSSIIVRHSVFPTIDNNETIHGVTMPADGYVIIEGNYFGGTTGYSDIIDYTGGRRPGPILQVLNNTFNGGSDDALDLDGTDAHIEGNTFMRIHQDAARESGSYAIATDAGSELVVVRNLFYDNDHALLLKNGASAVFNNNTVAHIRTNSPSVVPASVIAFGEPQRSGVTGGAGATLDGNIFWDIDSDRHFLYFTNEVMYLSVDHSILSGTNHPGNGNLNLDPMFINATNHFGLAVGSPAIGTGPNGLDMGAYVPGGATITGEPVSPTSLTEASLTVAGPGITDYRYRVNNRPYSAEIPVSNPITLTGLTNGAYQVNVVGKNSAGVWQEFTNATASRLWIVNPALQGLHLNEVLARNDSAVNVSGRYPDLVELYNDGLMAIDLSGMSLTDDRDSPRKFVFPQGYPPLASGQYLVVYADTGGAYPGPRLGFGLGQDGDQVYLFSAQGRLIDSVRFGRQLADVSIGRLADGQWSLTQPTFGAANRAAALGSPFALKINEWLAAGVSPSTEDYIELYNTSAQPINLAGLYLTDVPESLQNLHEIAALSFIPANGYSLFIADGNAGAGADHVNFRLAAEQGLIGLFSTDRRPIDIVYYGPQTNNISQGRSPNGSTNIVFFNVPTPGSPNPAPLPPDGLHIYINEVLAKNISLTLTNVFGPALGNATPEWIELYNSTANSMDLAGMSLSDNVALPRKFVFPADTIIPSLGYLVIMCDGSIPASLDHSGPVLSSGIGIKGNGDVVYLFDTLVNGGSLLDSVAYGVQAQDFSIGRNPAALTNWGLATPTPQGQNIVAALGDRMQLKINEWVADPLPGDDDWFEIFNPNPQPVEISGLFLTDDLSTPASRIQFQIAPLSFVGTELYGFEVFYADNNVTAGPNHVNFKLSGSGESIGLYLNAATAIDVVTFNQQTEGVSEGRLPDGNPSNIIRFPFSPTPGDSNYRPLINVVISEVLSHSNGDSLEDAIELHNVTSGALSIGGWYLSDQRRALKKFQIPLGTSIPGGGYIVFYENQFNSNPDLSTSFSLDSAKGDQVYLSTGNASGDLTGYRTSVDFGAAEPDVSFGSYVNSVTNVLFVAMSQRTFGADNPETVVEFRAGTGAANAYPKVGPVVINEIMYHPPDLAGSNERDEFIELHNITSTNVPLHHPDFPTNTWRLRDAVDFDFPPNLSIPAGEYLIVVGFDPLIDTNALAGFRAQYFLSEAVAIVGPYAGKLDNGGENVELYMPDRPEPVGDPDEGYVPYIEVDRIKYSDDPPWDARADGTGFSLQRKEANEFGNDPANWEAAPPTPGPAGLLDSDNDGMPDGWEIAYGLNPNANDALDDKDEDGMRNIDEFYAGTLPNSNASHLKVDMAYGSTVQISFTAVTDRSYAVEYRDSLAEGSWIELDRYPAPQASPLTKHSVDANPGVTRFYRVRVTRTP